MRGMLEKLVPLLLPAPDPGKPPRRKWWRFPQGLRPLNGVAIIWIGIATLALGLTVWRLTHNWAFWWILFFPGATLTTIGIVRVVRESP